MPEIKIFFSNVDISKEAYGSKDNVIANSDFLNGLTYKEAAKKLEELKPRIRKKRLPFARCRFSSEILGEPFSVLCEWIAAND
jgi:leucyl-tRNA synthetase